MEEHPMDTILCYSQQKRRERCPLVVENKRRLPIQFV